jgi:hypothetical protein
MRTPENKKTRRVGSVMIPSAVSATSSMLDSKLLPPKPPMEFG